MVWWLVAILLAIPILGYAEIHLTGGIWKGRLFRREPEIVADLPWRIQAGFPLPIFLIIKDAHQFPIHLQEVIVEIQNPHGRVPAQRYKFAFTEFINVPLGFRKMVLPPEFFPHSGQYIVNLWIRYRRGKREFLAYQDNYHHSHKPVYTVFIDNDPLPHAANWHWGDMHTHSAYTNDPIEFGPPLPVLSEAAQALGLQFVGVTDHSYDFGDIPNAGAHNPLQWQTFLTEVERLNHQKAGAVLLPGEEVSVRNSKGGIVHALVFGSRQFYPGNSDGAIRFGNPGQSLTLSELIKAVQHTGGLVVAAHPLEVPPVPQRILLRRSFWHAADLHQFGINHWQIHNGITEKAFHLGVNHWILALGNGQRVGIIAGTDAHGNLNVNRHIATPLLALNYTHTQLLGQARTAVYVEGTLTPERILRAIANHHTIISTGPFCSIHIQGPNTTASIGETVSRQESLRLVIIAKSTPYWGAIRQLMVFWGTQNGARENFRHIAIHHHNKYYFATEEPLPDPDTIQYIRAQLFTENGTQVYFCLTNPIWFRT